MNVEIGRQKIILLFVNNQDEQFLGIHKSESDIYIGFSTSPTFAVHVRGVGALHSQKTKKLRK
jgi:hypothetical protein